MTTLPAIEDFVFPHDELPRELDIQLWTFVRLVWGENLLGDARFRTRSWDDPPPTHFGRAAGELLISHALVLPLSFATDGRTLRVGGVGAVLTFPQFRREGHASSVMRRVGEHVHRTADVGMLFCDVRNVPFYERVGWIALPRGRVLIDGEIRDDVVMVLGDGALVPDPLRLPWSW
jgi:GNAT superfamily N-acetyltransferase